MESRERWSVRESNPLRTVLQTVALPIELTDQRGMSAPPRRRHHHGSTVIVCVGRSLERKEEELNLTRDTRANRVPSDLRASRIYLPVSRVAACVVQSGRQDSNLRSPVPQTGAFAGLSYALISKSQCR